MVKVIVKKQPTYACSVSFFWIQQVWLLAGYDGMGPEMQAALIKHEEGHCKHHDMEKRIFIYPFLFPIYGWLCRQDEFAADRYAAKAGYKKQLMEFLKQDCEGGFFHPSHEERRKRLALLA